MDSLLALAGVASYAKLLKSEDIDLVSAVPSLLLHDFFKSQQLEVTDDLRGRLPSKVLTSETARQAAGKQYISSGYAKLLGVDPPNSQTVVWDIPADNPCSDYLFACLMQRRRNSFGKLGIHIIANFPRETLQKNHWDIAIHRIAVVVQAFFYQKFYPVAGIQYKTQEQEEFIGGYFLRKTEDIWQVVEWLATAAFYVGVEDWIFHLAASCKIPCFVFRQPRIDQSAYEYHYGEFPLWYYNINGVIDWEEKNVLKEFSRLQSQLLSVY